VLVLSQGHWRHHHQWLGLQVVFEDVKSHAEKPYTMVRCMLTIDLQRLMVELLWWQM
jgi:hypothetical protein